MAKIRKIYDQTIKPDGSKTTIYPITSTRAVYTPEGETLDSYLKDGYFHGADLRGYKTVSNVTDLPTTENQFGWLIGEDLYIWVGTGGDTLGGLYQNCGHFRTPYVPDGEDLVADSNNELKLKDRTVEDGGMGYVILRKNKTFAEQITEENTIYVIRYDFTLSENITIPANCVLEFDGGNISGAYTIIGNNTYLIGTISVGCTITGTVKNEYLKYSWFDNTTKLVSSAKALNCGVDFDIPITTTSILDLEGIADVRIKGITNTEDTPVILGSGTSMYKTCHCDIEKCSYIKIVGGKRLFYNIWDCNKLTIIADSNVNGHNCIAYSTFNLGRIGHLYIDGVDDGYVNENTFIGGVIDNLTITGNYSHNGNVLYHPKMESCTININNGNCNIIDNARLEGNISVTFGVGTHNNVIKNNWRGFGNGFVVPLFTPNVLLGNLTNNGDVSNRVYMDTDGLDIKEFQIDRNYLSVFDSDIPSVTTNTYDFTVKYGGYPTNYKGYIANMHIPVDGQPFGVLLDIGAATGLYAYLQFFDDTDTQITSGATVKSLPNLTSDVGGTYGPNGPYNYYCISVESVPSSAKYAKILLQNRTNDQVYTAINVKIISRINPPSTKAYFYPLEESLK